MLFGGKLLFVFSWLSTKLQNQYIFLIFKLRAHNCAKRNHHYCHHCHQCHHQLHQQRCRHQALASSISAQIRSTEFTTNLCCDILSHTYDMQLCTTNNFLSTSSNWLFPFFRRTSCWSQQHASLPKRAFSCHCFRTVLHQHQHCWAVEISTSQTVQLGASYT